MKRASLYPRLVLSGLALTLLSSGVWANQQGFRLAYSNNDDIEVFIDDAPEDKWCRETITIRAVAGPRGSVDTFSELMPKLGALMAMQCPQARTVNWQLNNTHGELIGRGHSGPSTNWLLITDSDSASLQTSTPDKEATSAEAPTETASKETIDAEEPSTDTAAPETETSEAKALIDEEAETEGPSTDTAEAEAKTDTSEPEAKELSADDNATEVTTPEEVKAPEEPDPRRFALADFVVADSADLPYASGGKELVEAMTTFKDQDGCQLRTISTFKTDVKDLVVLTDGFSCDEDGYLHGEGTVEVLRVDGASLNSARQMILQHGVPVQDSRFNFFVPELATSRYQPNSWSRSNMYFFPFGSNEALNSHYFFRSRVDVSSGFYDLGSFVFDQDALYVLTDKVDDFRHIDTIRPHVEAAIAHLDQFPHVGADDSRIVNFDLHFYDNYQVGVNQGALEGRLYSVRISRNKPWGEPPTAWVFESRRGESLLFRREEEAERARQRQREQEEREQQRQREREERERQRKLEQEKRELERQQREAASQQRTYLQIYEQLLENNDVLASLRENIFYMPFTGGRYTETLAEGWIRPFAEVVHVSEQIETMALVDYPYEIQLLNTTLEPGWYFVEGKQHLDANTQDQQGFPITRVILEEGKVAYPCQEVGCVELDDPLAATRLQIEQPDWTPEEAQAIINAAPKGGIFGW